MSFINNKNQNYQLGDLFGFYNDYLNNIYKQIVVAQKEVEIFDAKGFFDKYNSVFKNFTDEQLRNLANAFMNNKQTELLSESLRGKTGNAIRIPFEEFVDKNGLLFKEFFSNQDNTIHNDLLNHLDNSKKDFEVSFKEYFNI